MLNYLKEFLPPAMQNELPQIDIKTPPRIVLNHLVNNKIINNKTEINLNEIIYTFAYTIYGDILFCYSDYGICHLSFIDPSESKKEAVAKVRKIWKDVKHFEFDSTLSSYGSNFLNFETSSLTNNVTILLKGSEFQFQVWKTLMCIPIGSKVSYNHIANAIGRPRAYRAVGTAVGQNPVAILVPCHRVIKSDGEIGDYRWGSERKKKILEIEATKSLLH